MAIAETIDLQAYCRDVAKRAKAASAGLASTSGQQKIDWLKLSAKRIREQADEIFAANEHDVAAAADNRLTDVQIDRLRLNPARLEGVAAGLESVAALPELVGEVIESSIRPERAGSAQGPRAAGGGVLHLRIAAERDGRRRGDLRQERQRGDPARRQGSGPFQPGHRRTAGRGDP